MNIYNALGSVNVLVDVEGYFAPTPAGVVAGLFHPIAPVRVCDTRPASPTPLCSAHGALGPGASMVVNFATAGGLPGDGTAEAAVVNLTGVAGTASTYLSLFPTNASGGCTPTGTSTINLAAGAVRGESSDGDARSVDNRWGQRRALRLQRCRHHQRARRRQRLVWKLDRTASPAGYQYQAIAPTRICDTRVGIDLLRSAGSHRSPRSSRLITVAGHAGVPAFGSATTVVAMIANLTAVVPTASDIPDPVPGEPDQPRRQVSDLNLKAGAVLPNLAVVEVDTMPADAHDGEVYLYNGAGSVNAIIDLEGWFQ